MDYPNYFSQFGKVNYKELQSFSREDVKVEYRHHTITWYLDVISSGELILDSDFQRSGGVWSSVKKSRFIESLLMHLPITPIFLSQDHDFNYEVIDGLQRLTTIKSFIEDNEFELTDLEFYKDLEGYKFQDLPSVIRRFLQTSTIPVSVLLPGVKKDLKVSIFHRINTSGVTLTDHEIRASLHIKSYFYKSLTKASFEYIEERLKKKDVRKKYQELLLKTISIHLFGLSNYNKCTNMKDFLDKSMNVLCSLEKNYVDEIFLKYANSYSLLEASFKTVDPFNNEKGRFTNSMYLSVMLRFLNNDITHIDEEGFKRVVKDEKFRSLVSNGSSKLQAIQTRDKMLSEVIC